MTSKNESIPVEFAIRMVGKWQETYRWVPILGAVAAVAMAIAAGANNLPAPFSTPVGSGALTFLKASITACLIYVPGAAFASNSTVNTLFSDFLKENQPSEGFLMWSMVVVLISATIWLAIATYLELPVSSQQATQGALLGTMLVTEGFDYIPMWNENENHNFNGGGLLWIFLEWTVAPLLACICACILFALLKACLLRHENATKRILIFLPIDFGISAGLLCLFLMYQVIANIVHVPTWAIMTAIALATFIGALLSLVVVVPLAIKKFDATKEYRTAKKNTSEKEQSVESQEQNSDTKGEDDVEEVLRDFMEMRVLETVYEEEERSWASPDAIQTIESPDQAQPTSQNNLTEQYTPFKKLLEFTPNHLVQSKNFQKIEKLGSVEIASKFFKNLTKSTESPVIEYDRQTLIRHALAEKYDEIEEFFSFPQLLASCIFALIQSASEIAAIVSPYGAIVDIFKHRAKYSGNREDVKSIHVSWWFRAVGGLAAAIGFFVFGWRLTQCLGGKLTYMSNSRGLAAQLSTVAAVIIVTRIDLPVTSVHAFVGSLVGVGIADNVQNVNWKLLVKFLCGWVMTIVFSCAVAYMIFSATIHAPAYVVP